MEEISETEDFKYLERLLLAGEKISDLPVDVKINRNYNPPIYLLKVLRPVLRESIEDGSDGYDTYQHFYYGESCKKTTNPGLLDIGGSSPNLIDAFNFFVTAISMDFYTDFDHKQFKGLNAIEALERLEEIAANQ